MESKKIKKLSPSKDKSKGNKKSGSLIGIPKSVKGNNEIESSHILTLSDTKSKNAIALLNDSNNQINMKSPLAITENEIESLNKSQYLQVPLLHENPILTNEDILPIKLSIPQEIKKKIKLEINNDYSKDENVDKILKDTEQLLNDIIEAKKGIDNNDAE